MGFAGNLGDRGCADGVFTTESLRDDTELELTANSCADKRILRLQHDTAFRSSVHHRRLSTVNEVPPSYSANQNILYAAPQRSSIHDITSMIDSSSTEQQHLPSTPARSQIPLLASRWGSTYGSQSEDHHAATSEAGITEPGCETSDLTLQLNIPQVPIPVLVNLKYRRREGDGSIRFDSVAYGSGYAASEMGSYSQQSLVQYADHTTPGDENVPPPYYRD